ncbi:MAG: UbiA family prenyltransferase [Nitrospinae bacterium]|nr:UbiA family prenyltransferase [Nitrospinota bacterium]
MAANLIENLKVISNDIKLQHTVFALPFAIVGAFMAGQGSPGAKTILLIIVAMFFARSSAMAFNRILDSEFDGKNKRTSGRAIPAGLITKKNYYFFFILTSLFFIATCFFINHLAFYLAPIALIIVCFYSYCKRFTALSHLVLGFALSLAPIGAWIAVNEELSLTPLLLGAAVMFWLAGFDILYSLQDMDFDKNMGLHSIPESLGVEKSLMLARLFHVIMILLLYVITYTYPTGWFYYAGILLCIAFLVYEHSLVKPSDLTKINIAFFNVNGLLSIFFMVLILLDIFY